MTLLTPLYVQPAAGDPEISYSALQDRAGLLASIFSREGVLDVDAGQLAVTQRAEGASYSIDIAAGRAAITGDDVSDQGIYLCTNTTKKNLATPSPPASGTRTHRVIARVRDKLHNGSWTVYDWQLAILTDTGTGLPALPASAIHLATLTMSAGMTSVTNADIVNAPPRATVGTKARVGSIPVFNNSWSATEATRQPAFNINPDGWVLLTGFIRRIANAFTVNPGTAYSFAGPVPAAIRTAGNRDMPGITTNGPVLIQLLPDGVLQFVSVTSHTFDVNDWVSLDGLTYRLDS